MKLHHLILRLFVFQSGNVVSAAQSKEDSLPESPIPEATQLHLKLKSVRIGTLRSEESESLIISSQRFIIRFTTQGKVLCLGKYL